MRSTAYRQARCHCSRAVPHNRRVARTLVVSAFLSVHTQASEMDQAKTYLAEGRLKEAIELLVKETDENPAHEAARVLLAEAYEKAEQPDRAMAAWQDLMALSRNESNLRKARHALSRFRRLQLDRMDLEESNTPGRTADPFRIPMPEVEWTGLEVVEDTKHLPASLPPPVNFELPPFVQETEHFTVYTANERLSNVIGQRAEIYLDFMVKKLFGGRAWAVRFPILVYTTVEDYQQHGGPAGSGGVTYRHLTGKTQAIILFQLKPDFSRSTTSRRGGGTVSGAREVWRYGIESVLPHELTHAVINEFFGGQPTPQWLHEAVAGRFEQTRDHYGEAARLARKVVAGEYFRMRDLFDQKGYPERIELFYEQSAAVVLYLFEAGPETMHAFLGELAAGRGHDAACAAALGIPEGNAVEEFERRWVDWMCRRYRKDLNPAADKTETASAERSNHDIFLPWVNERDTVDQVSHWRDVDLTSLSGFKTLGPPLHGAAAKSEWSVADGLLRCSATDETRASLLGIRMNETAPTALTCDVRYLGGPDDSRRWFGFVQLDADGHDTRVEALAPLRDNDQHKVVCVWSDDLAVYVDGVCTGRYPATQVSGNAQDVDYPLALVAYGPLAVQNLRIGAIKTFSDKPVVAPADSRASPRPEQPNERRSRDSRRRSRDDKKEP